MNLVPLGQGLKIPVQSYQSVQFRFIFN
jgi:hypothetical protein